MTRYHFVEQVLQQRRRQVFAVRRRGIWPFRRDVRVQVGEEIAVDPLPHAKVTIWDGPTMGTILAEVRADELGVVDLDAANIEATRVWMSAEGGQHGGGWL